MAENELKPGDKCCLKSNTELRYVIISINENGIAKCRNKKGEVEEIELIALQPIGFSGFVTGLYDKNE